MSDLRAAEELLRIWASNDPQGVVAQAVVTVLDVMRERDHAINWHTTCTGCAKLLDSNYDEYMRRQEAETARDEAIAVAKNYEEVLEMAHLALRDYEIGCEWDLSVYSEPSRNAIRDILRERKGNARSS